MKKLLAMVLSLLFLVGCTPLQEGTEPTLPPTEWEQPLGPALPRENGPFEQAAGGALRVWPLEQHCDGLLLFGETVLLYFTDERTQLNAYVGEDLRLKQSVSRYPQMPDDSAGIAVFRQGLSYYNQETRTLVVLDKNLREIRKQTMPDSLCGIPVVSQDMNTVYYSVGQELRAMDLETGIGHMLRQHMGGTMVLSGSLFDTTVLVVQAEGNDGSVTTSFIRTEDGLEIGKEDTLISGDSGTSGYFLNLGSGGIPVRLYGQGESSLHLFTPLEPEAQVYFQTDLGAVVTARETKTGTELSFYNLKTGLRIATLSLPGITGVHSVNADAQGCVWFLNDQNMLCRWTTGASPVEDTTVYTQVWDPNRKPDQAATEHCQEAVEALAAEYGISLRVFGDAIAAPWNQLTAEYRPEVYEHMLSVMDRVLSSFPDGFLARLSSASENGLLTVSLVAYAGPQGSGQTWLDGNAHLAVAPGEAMDRELLRSIYRVMDTYILGKNSMLDDWNAEKPAEDRAELFVQAMKADNARLFSDDATQRKLESLCRAIRDAFAFDKDEKNLPWEQYLEEPLK